ncbi:hypothetical protein NC653_035740 [Populus alba x Populus x berolinensis]|uniref:Uncharacterized protein n=1 Tax=Populus alba x Populus x berolinensis TaxID=444605 RepID=A0AAD6LI38_9ROSI|nr:hypothetical protein NC653_035740 [Populus alba x Populus x berolinensis]
MINSELPLTNSLLPVPVTIPKSASLSEGASSVLTPTNATVWPCCFRQRTRRSLSEGRGFPITQILLTTSFLCSSLKLRKVSPPCSDMPGPLCIPYFLAMSSITDSLSSETSTMLTPAFLQASTASIVSSHLGGWDLFIPIINGKPDKKWHSFYHLYQESSQASCQVTDFPARFPDNSLDKFRNLLWLLFSLEFWQARILIFLSSFKSQEQHYQDKNRGYEPSYFCVLAHLVELSW